MPLSAYAALCTTTRGKIDSSSPAVGPSYISTQIHQKRIRRYCWRSRQRRGRTEQTRRARKTGQVRVTWRRAMTLIGSWPKRGRCITVVVRRN